MAPRITCDHCAEVIGVYEPVVLVTDGKARETSRAAEPAVGAERGERYHLACYVERSASAVA
jgi:hypothetical protein